MIEMSKCIRNTRKRTLYTNGGLVSNVYSITYGPRFPFKYTKNPQTVVGELINIELPPHQDLRIDEQQETRKSGNKE